jgi:hypothetical protein
MGSTLFFSFGIRLLALLSVSHAALVLVIWWGMSNADFLPLSGRAWLILAWLWLAWPLILGLHQARSPLLVLIPSVVGALLLAPCVPTIFAFTIWAVRGFAP